MSLFRLKIVLWYGGVLLFTLVVVRLATVGVTRSVLYSDLDESLRAETLWIRDVLRSYRERGIPDQEIVDEIGRRTRLSPRKELVEVYDGEGQSYFRSANLEDDTLQVLAARVALPIGRARNVHDRQGEGLRLVGLREPDYEIYVGYPLTDVDAAIGTVFTSFILLIPLALLMALGGGIFLLRRSLAPLRWLDHYAEELAELPLDQTLPEPPARSGGEVERLVSRIHQIVKRMRESLRRSLGFSSLTSHELRTPLTVLRSRLEEAAREETDQEELRTTISEVYDEILRLDRVVQDLLSVAAIEARTIRFDLELRDLGGLAAEFAADASVLCEASGITFEFVRGAPADTQVDVTRIRQVLFNLLDNALKHTPVGGRVELRQGIEDGYGVLSLGDTGSGIPPEHVERIFDPFYRPPGTRRGIGVGLALVRWLVEAHNGTVNVRSKVGAGTTFTIRLPLA